MDTNFYRIITANAFERIPLDGIVGGRNDRQRWSQDRTLVMVERQKGFVTNDRWLTHEEALQTIQTPEWTHPEPYTDNNGENES